MIFGASFDSVVCLDVDDISEASWMVGFMEDLAGRISRRFDLGDCLIVLSSMDDKKGKMNFHLIFDRRLPWFSIHRIITKLARDRILEKKLSSLAIDRNHFTTRFAEKNGNDRPFPIGYVSVSRRFSDWNGIRIWLDHWKLARNISKDSK